MLSFLYMVPMAHSVVKRCWSCEHKCSTVRAPSRAGLSLRVIFPLRRRLKTPFPRTSPTPASQFRRERPKSGNFQSVCGDLSEDLGPGDFLGPWGCQNLPLRAKTRHDLRRGLQVWHAWYPPRRSLLVQFCQFWLWGYAGNFTTLDAGLFTLGMRHSHLHRTTSGRATSHPGM